MRCLGNWGWDKLDEIQDDILVKKKWHGIEKQSFHFSAGQLRLVSYINICVGGSDASNGLAEPEGGGEETQASAETWEKKS